MFQAVDGRCFFDMTSRDPSPDSSGSATDLPMTRTRRHRPADSSHRRLAVLTSFVGRSRSRFASVSFAFAIFLGIASCVDHSSRKPSDFTDQRIYHKQTFTVDRIIDGDTLRIDRPDGNESTTNIRLLGIDSPELSEPGDLGERSRSYVEARLKRGSRVTLRLDEERSRDRYGRLLAFVYLSNFELLNESIVRDGWAFAYRAYDHSLSGQLEQAETVARTGRRGMWKTMKFELMPDWRQRWMNERGLTWN